MPGLIDGAFFIFDSSTELLIKLIPLVFLTRVLITKIMLRSPIHYGILVQDLIFTYVGFFFFEDLIRYILEIPNYAQGFVGYTKELNLSIDNKEKSYFWLFTVGTKDLLDLVGALFYWIMGYIYLIFMSLLIAMGAYIIFFSSMFRMRWMMSVFVILLVMNSMWPFLWYMVDNLSAKVMIEVGKSKSNYGLLTAAIGSGIVKIGIPLLGFLYALKDPVSMVSNVVGGAKQGARPIRKGVDKTVNAGFKVATFAGGASAKVALGARNASKSVGLDQVKKAHLDPRISNAKINLGILKNNGLNTLSKPVSKIKAAKEKLKDSAPAAVYGVQKVLKSKSLNTNENSVRTRTKSFSEYKKTMNTKVQSYAKTEQNTSSVGTNVTKVQDFKKQIATSSIKKNEVTKVPGVSAKQKGSWVWAQSSNTKTDEILKDKGFKYSKKRDEWYFGESK